MIDHLLQLLWPVTYVACTIGLLLVIEAHIRAQEQSTMITLTLFASQSKQIIIKILDLKDILGLYCGIKVVIRCQIVDFTLSQYIVIHIAIRPCLSQYIAIHFLVAIPIPSYKHYLLFHTRLFMRGMCNWV